MSIRTRLAIAVGLVLMVMLVVLGFATVRATNEILTDRVDRQIDESKNELEKQDKAQGLIEKALGLRPPAQYASDKYNENLVAIGVIDASTGDPIVWVEKSGSGEGPDAPPEIPDIDTAEFDNFGSKSMEVDSSDGSMTYLVRVFSVKNEVTNQQYPYYFVIAAPLNDVHDTISTLTKWLIAGGIAALIVTTSIVWFIIRQGLRPVEKMIDTASAIAQGDLSQRVPDSAIDPYTELGRLGGALNEMLVHIENSSNLRDESEARLRQFIADAAHELRTPLTSLRGYAELYRQGALRDTPAVANAMNRIESEGTRMARLVDELLLLARLDQQRGLELAQVDIVDIVRDAVGDFRVVEPNRPVVDNLGEPAVVLGDRLRLRQIVDNLLTNARVHTPPLTPVGVSVRIVGSTVRLEVHDDGQGISKEDQAHIFERFWRGDPSRGRRSGSSGLGLSIVSSLVELHGGSISVQSEPGTGTSFTVELPVIRPETRPPASIPPRDAAVSATSSD